MVSEFGNFPGVRITTAGGGITAVTIGEEEKLVLFIEEFAIPSKTLLTLCDGKIVIIALGRLNIEKISPLSGPYNIRVNFFPGLSTCHSIFFF